MLTLCGKRYRFCDGRSRRTFLKIGGLSLGAMGTLSLADVLRAEAATGTGRSHKAVINIMLGGGPLHIDMWDIKTEDPRRVQLNRDKRTECSRRRAISDDRRVDG